MVGSAALMALIPLDSGASARTGAVTLTGDAEFDAVYVASGPQAVYDPETDSTFLVFLQVNTRDLYVTRYWHATGTLDTAVQVGTYPISASDNHGNPALAITPSGTLIVWWGAHNTAFQLSRSDNPRDISSWTTSSMQDGTYPFLAVADDGTVFLVYRSGTGHGSTFPAHEYLGMRYSTDDGVTWSTAVELIDTTGTPEAASDVYNWAAELADDGRLHLTWVVARGASHDGTRTNLYHAAYDPSDGHMYTAGGTDLGTVVTWAEHPDCLAATATDTNLAPPTMFASDDIWIAWAEVADQDLQVTRWDGTSWTTVDTGITLSTEWVSPLIVRWRDVTGVLAPITGGALHLYLTEDDGATWFDAGAVVDATVNNTSLVAGGGPFLALVEQGTSPVTIYALPATTALADHTHTDLTVTATDVRDAGRWEVLLDDAEQPVSTGDGDWLYVWLGGT